MGSGGETHFGEGVPEEQRERLEGALSPLVAGAMAHPWSRGQLAEALENPRAILRLAASPDPAAPPAGCVIGRWLAADLVEVDLVAVDPAHRREGIAGRLLDGFLAAISSAGATECQLELAHDNAPAFGLYVGTGFVVVGRRERYYPDGADALLLSWRAPEG